MFQPATSTKTRIEYEPREIFSASGFVDCAIWAGDARILYSSSANGKNEIWRVNSDGSNPEQLTAGANLSFGFTVSPVDGSIVFCSSENGRHSLKLMNADGKNIHLLTDGAEDIYPNFTADGQTIVFQRGIKGNSSADAGRLFWPFSR